MAGDAWTHSLGMNAPRGFTDHLPGFSTNGTEARFYRANRVFWTPFIKNPIFRDKEPGCGRGEFRGLGTLGHIAFA